MQLKREEGHLSHSSFIEFVVFSSSFSFDSEVLWSFCWESIFCVVSVTESRVKVVFIVSRCVLCASQFHSKILLISPFSTQNWCKRKSSLTSPFACMQQQQLRKESEREKSFHPFMRIEDLKEEEGFHFHYSLRVSFSSLIEFWREREENLSTNSIFSIKPTSLLLFHTK